MSILEYPHDSLRTPTRVCTKNDIKQLRVVYSKMKKQLKESEGLGLAANQIGENLSLIIVGDTPLVNPTFFSKSKKMVVSNEACLSIPNTFVEIKRAKWVWITYDDLNFVSKHNIRFSGRLSACAQHEMDHLKGKLIIDYV